MSRITMEVNSLLIPGAATTNFATGSIPLSVALTNNLAPTWKCILILESFASSLQTHSWYISGRNGRFVSLPKSVPRIPSTTSSAPAAVGNYRWSILVEDSGTDGFAKFIGLS